MQQFYTSPFVNFVLHSHWFHRRKLWTLSDHVRFSCQRWNPVDGFSERLLPSDRWQWSDVTGLQHQPMDNFQLPSSSWEWEGDWYVDENFEGEPTEKEVSYELLFFSLFPPFWLFWLFNVQFHVPRDGATQSTSPLRTTKTRSGTPVSVAGDGSATGGITPWIPGLRCVQSSLIVHIFSAFVCISIEYCTCSPITLSFCILTDSVAARHSPRSIQWHQLWRLGDQRGAQRTAVPVGSVPTGKGIYTPTHTP